MKNINKLPESMKKSFNEAKATTGMLSAAEADQVRHNNLVYTIRDIHGGKLVEARKDDDIFPMLVVEGKRRVELSERGTHKK